MKRLFGAFGALAMLLGFAACSSDEPTPPPVTTTTTSTTPVVQTVNYPSRGQQIMATVVLPAGEGPFPLVVMAHGHGGSREENIGFAAIANAMAEQGIASIRMDFPGCGDSTEEFQQNTLTNMEADVMAAVTYAQTTYPVDANLTGIFGYSMGGRIALELLANPDTNEAFAAAVFLAPAASTVDMKALFGGPDAWEEMKATADAEGYVSYTTIYGQVQNLSKEWFADLEADPDPSAAAAAAFQPRTSMVIYADDDEAVSPSISQAVAAAFGSEVVTATGDGHSYGFYSEKTDVLNTVANSAAQFFAINLK
ncbi:MAG: alpha/beta hydrolase [Propionibacteriaceae bacterium]|nr:alpha/beta hydrolase [Propionibacteriaceae bacterium]